jgi:hypothetical protein
MLLLISLLALVLKEITGSRSSVLENIFFSITARSFSYDSPGRVLAVVVGAGAQHEVDHLVAEVLGVGNPGRFLDLLQFLVERLRLKISPVFGSRNS